LQDFAFALLIGVASGAYSSIFIASPVLTHWKEREPVYRARRHRIETERGTVPAYAEASADIEPAGERLRRRTGRITEPQPETVSAAEFEQLKRDIAEEEAEPSRRTSTLTKRLSHTPESGGGRKAAPGRPPKPSRPAAPGRSPAPSRPASPDARQAGPAEPPAAPNPPATNGESGADFERAPDVAENEGMAPTQKPSRPAKSRPRNRRHGRRR
jgi:SecD/SecF fusion protein